MSQVIDVHSHLYPDWFVDHFRTRSDVPRVEPEGSGERFLLFSTADGGESGPLLTEEYTTIEAKLSFMERHGIDRSVVSLGNPWFEFFDPDESLRMARDANSRLSTLREETSGRLIGMGVLPRADPHDVAKVIEEVAAEPRLRGVISSTAVGGLLLDDPRLAPVWEALVSTQVPLMIHPMMAEVPPELSGYGIAMSAGIGFPFQTTIALARLLLGGVLERFPELRLVAAHGGGALPYLIGRLEGTNVLTSDPAPLARVAGKLLFDAALYEPEAVRLAAEFVGPDRLMFGTDHPFPNADVPRIRRAIASGVPDPERDTIFGLAAAHWFTLD